MLRAAAPVPGALVQATREAEATHLEIEALVTLVLRLGYLSGSYVAPTLRAIDELRETRPRPTSLLVDPSFLFGSSVPPENV